MCCRLFASLRRHALHRGLVKAFLLPAMVLDDGLQVADGIDMWLEGPVYRAADDKVALSAINRGRLWSTGPIDAESTNGVTINAANQGAVDIVAGHLSTGNGTIARATGGNVRLRGSGTDSRGLLDVQLTGGHGVNSFEGSQIELDNVDIMLRGFAGSAVTASVSDTVWRHSLVRGDGLVAFGGVFLGGTALLEDVDINVGNSAVLANSGVKLVIRDSHLSSQEGTGLSAEGAYSIELERVRIDTNNTAPGIRMGGNSVDSHLRQVQVHTRGYTANALAIGEGQGLAPGAAASVYASGIDFHTEGGNASAIDTRFGYLQIDGGSIVTDGYQSHGAHAWGEKRPDVHQKLSQLDITVYGRDSLGVASRAALTDVDHSHVLNAGDRYRVAGAGIGARDAGVLNFTDGTVETTGVGTPGARAWNGDAHLNVNNSRIITRGDGSFGLELIEGGEADLTQVAIQTVGEGAWGAMVQGEQDQLRMHGGSIDAANAGALYAGSGAQIEVDGGASLRGNGLLLGLDGHADMPMQFSLSHSDAEGDIRWVDTQNEKEDPARRARIQLLEGALWHGATDAVDSLLVSGSTWQLRDISRVQQLTLDNGTIRFDTPVDHRYKRLRVMGDYSGGGGVIALSVHLNGGGPEERTDQLLIKGDVTTTGTTWLEVTPRGDGGNTDRNQNGIVDADEGISVVQVSGRSRRNAFALRNGYVAVGPWQYNLHAFGPGQAQSTGADGDPLSWDYRLANRYVSAGEGDGAGDGISQDPGDADFDTPPTPGRPAVVPQVPAYLTAPTALFQYGNRMMDTLQQRLGDVRLPRGDGNDGEVYARYIGGGQRYHTNRSFAEYGYDFYQHTTALQVGAGLIGWVGDRGAVRVGWAVDSGRNTVTPIAVDGVTRSRFDAHGGMAWVTWLADAGWHASAIVGGESYGGSLDAGNGDHIAHLRAHAWASSVEIGYPFVLGGWQLEPQWQMRYQTMRFPLIEDRDGLESTLRVTAQTIHRLGLSVARAAPQRWSPYMRVDLMHAEGGAIDLDVNSPAWNLGSTFAGGRMANVYRVGAGLHAQLGRHWAVYAEGDYLGTIGAYGFSGWLANTGLRFDF